MLQINKKQHKNLNKLTWLVKGTLCSFWEEIWITRERSLVTDVCIPKQSK